jgi:hypothetical protein
MVTLQPVWCLSVAARSSWLLERIWPGGGRSLAVGALGCCLALVRLNCLYPIPLAQLHSEVVLRG